MTHYLLAIYHDPGVQASQSAYSSEEDMQAAFARVNAFNDELKAEGNWVYACGLTAPEDAQQVTPTGELVAGPAVAGSKQLGGFWVIDAADMEAAVVVAKRGAKACGQPVEVRPMQ
ncbi:YciI family protein [Corynebacterium breve]|uniref:YciI family protein n=1 Tax=Corynebacterium breve TaxID=3049799 RepID=A0ABY8VDV7_9CORY|nr:YciI family protein [Corynebacterium breve]WIM67846.1 YciI family protein [Corynebacterium breve]